MNKNKTAWQLDVDDELPDAAESLEQFAESERLKNKVPISIRLDEDVLNYFKSFNSKGYQTRISRVLNQWVEMHRRGVEAANKAK